MSPIVRILFVCVGGEVALTLLYGLRILQGEGSGLLWGGLALLGGALGTLAYTVWRAIKQK